MSRQPPLGADRGQDLDARQKSRFEGSSRVVTGNRLTDGRVVWFTESGDWSERIERARVLRPGEPSDSGVLEAARADIGRRRVVDVYEVDLVDEPTGDGAALRPATERERIRAFGPSVHPAFAPAGR